LRESEGRRELPGDVKAVNLNARDEESQKVIKDAGFKTHGLIIRDANEEIWKQAKRSGSF